MTKNPITGLEESPAAITGAGATQPAVPDQTMSASIPAAPKADLWGVQTPAVQPVTPTPAVSTKLESAQATAPQGVTVWQVATNPNLLTATDAYNPRTGGTETVNPSEQVNTGQYSEEEKAALAKSKWLTGSISQDAFYRDPTTGELSIKPEYTNWVTAPATPAVATSTVWLPVDNTKPHSQGDVWNAQTGNWEMPWTNGQGSNAVVDSIINSMENNGANPLAPDEKAAITAALTSTDPAAAIKLAQADAATKQQLAKEALTEFRARRDTEQKLTYDQQQNDLQTEQYKTQMNTQISQQKDNIDSTTNNMSMALWAAGRLTSQNAANAAKTAIDQQQNIYNNMISTRDNTLQQMANTLKYNQKALSDQYNDLTSTMLQESLSKIDALNKTGALDTQQGLIQARSVIDAANVAYLNHTTNYTTQLNNLTTQYEETRKFQMAQNTVDKDVSATMNQGQNTWKLYNAQWQAITGNDWQALTFNNATGQFISLGDDGLGWKVALFRNPDGTIRHEQAITAPKLTQDQIDAAKNAIAAHIDPDVVGKMLWLTWQQLATALKWTNIPNQEKVTQVSKEYTDEDGNTVKVNGYFDPKTNKYVYEDGSSDTTAPTSSSQISSAQKIAQYSIDQRNGRTNLQCGELVNDYWKMVTGKSMGIGNSIGSKTNAIRQAGISDVPVAGWIFVSDPLNNGIGHTGVVQSVNPDGSITVLEANAQGKEEGWEPNLVTYKADKIDGMMFSQAPAWGAAAVWEMSAWTPATKDPSSYGLKNDAEMQWAQDLSNWAATLANVTSFYGKNKNAVNRILAAKDAITSDTNSQALVDNGIDVNKIDPSMKKSILSMTPSALSALADVATYKAGIDMATARSTTGMNRVAFESAASAIAKARGDNNWSADQYKRISDNYAAYTDPTKWVGVKRAALNVAINHIDEQRKTLSELWNTDSPWLNDVLNTVKTAFWDGDVLAAKIVSQALGWEVAKAYAGSQSGEAERSEWAKNAQANLSPDMQQKFFQTTIKLLAGAARSIKSEGLKSVSVGGKPMRQLENVLDDNTRQVVQSIGIDPNSFESSEAALTKPTAAQISKATPKIVADIKAGKSLDEIKQHSISMWSDPSYIDAIYNANNSHKSTATGKTYSQAELQDIYNQK